MKKQNGARIITTYSQRLWRMTKRLFAVLFDVLTPRRLKMSLHALKDLGMHSASKYSFHINPQTKLRVRLRRVFGVAGHVTLFILRLLATKLRQCDRWLMSRSPQYAQLRRYFAHHPYQRSTSIFFVVLMVTSILLRFAVSASDLNKTWDFSNSSDYTFSNSSDLEYSGSSVRLKAQNYASDANTAALYHLDESSGSSVGDSSGNSNTATAVNSPSWSTGSLNNALSLNGTTQAVSAPDSVSLSLTQGNTIESWTKFASSLSANSQQTNQTIADKGNYKLYYDHETGKPTYELENSSASSWTQRAGDSLNSSWLNTGPSATLASVVMGSSLYTGNNASGQVWKFDGSNWSKIGGDGLNSGWPAGEYDSVYSLTTDGTNLYVGFGQGTGDGDVWRWNGSNWSKIGGDGINSSWSAGTYEDVYSLTFMSGNLYAGLGFSTNDAEVWKYNGTSWTQVGGDGLNSGWTGSQQVKTLVNDGSNIYAGISIVGTGGGADVWKYNGSTWSQIGGDGLNSSWAASTYQEVMSMFYQNGNLYAGLGNATANTYHAEVWQYTGSSWTKLAGSGVGFTASTYEGVASLSGDGTNVYAGLSLSQGDADVWKYNGSSWTQIGGDGLNSSWSLGYYNYTMAWFNSRLYVDATQASSGDVYYSWNGTAWSREGGQFYNGSWGAYGVTAVKSMTTVNGKLYAGLNGSPTVFEYDNSAWRIVGASGLNSAWGVSQYSAVYSMTSMGGNLYVGLIGGQNGDAEVWRYNGSTWTQIGGDGISSSWSGSYTRVYSLGSDGTDLFAGVGSTGGNGEVWRLRSGSWSKIGGTGVNGSWNGTYRNISSIGFYNGNLVVGSTGSLNGANDVWKWNGSSWTQIGGDGLNSSWNFGSIGNGEIDDLTVYGDKLIAAVGSLTAGDATIWQYDGTAWTKIGGDTVNSSWPSSTYNAVYSFGVYNGDLYAGLGSAVGNGEVWRWDGSSWSQIGGDNLNAGWSNVLETVRSLQVYKGKLFAGLGDTQNGDAKVYSYGNNGFLQGSTTSQDTSWHHIAGTYDGTTMKLYRDGTLIGSTSAALSMPDNSHELYVGRAWGAAGTGSQQSIFNGSLDEVRISNVARSSFTTHPYGSDRVAVRLSNAEYTSGVASWDGFTADESANGGTITYRLSDDNGASWRYWSGTDWSTSSDLSQSNDVSTVNSHISAFPITSGGMTWQAVFDGDGDQRVQLNSVTLAATSDTTPPAANASSILMKRSPSGTSVNDGDWTNAETPYFSWSPANDSQSPIKGYCLYLGTDNTADPVSTKGLLGTSPVTTHNDCQFIVGSESVDLATSGYLASALTSSNSTYYLKIKALDNAGNVYNGTSESFSFKFDNTQPTNPLFVSAPSQFVSSKQVTITWPTGDSNAAVDANSGIAGLQYKIGSGGTWYGDGHTGTQDSTDLLTNDGSYQTVDPEDFDNLNDGNNTIYFRTYDTAGNVSTSYITSVIKINTTSPTAPLNVTATPETNTLNSFAFSWQPPASYFGSAGNLEYCYTINTLPSANTCNYTSAGVTSLDAGAYATQPGDNTFYVVAKDEAGNINYITEAHTTFSANTSAPGLPRNLDVVDISVKATNNWRLTLSWDGPIDVGAGIASYKVMRSTDDSTYTQVASTSGTSYVDSGLAQQRYYYQVKACDSANKCGDEPSSVSALPTGKFTTPAEITSQPKVTDISTRKATISWSTDRDSDSRIQYGLKTGQYFSTEAAISAQNTDHEVMLNNLTAGTTYFAKAKWTDEDGNTGQTSEFSFKTAPAPVIKEAIAEARLTDATVTFTSKDAAKVKLYYGKSDGFGGSQVLNTSTSESTYSVALSGLDDGTKYFYKVNTFDSDNNEYDGNVYSFTTPARPRISNVRFQPVENQPSSTQKISWTTNVPATSEISYGVGNLAASVNDVKLVTAHELTVRGLNDDSTYQLVARSRDGSGNLASSDVQVFKTALDTRPPGMSNITVDVSIRGTGSEARGQIVVSWKTDEPSTSQVAYGDGSTGLLSSVTNEDSKLTTDHVIVISDLSTSRVYHLEPRSYDKGRNMGAGDQQIAIVGRGSDNVLSIIFNALQKIFGVGA